MQSMAGLATVLGDVSFVLKLLFVSLLFLRF